MARVSAVLLLLVAAAAAVNAVHLDFAKGLDGWTHAADSTYTGVFEVETLHDLDWAGLKVSKRRCKADHGVPGPASSAPLHSASARPHAIWRCPDHTPPCAMAPWNLPRPPSPRPARAAAAAARRFWISPHHHPSPAPRCLQVTEKAKHYGISKVLPAPVDPAKDLVLQYDLKFTAGHTCAGAYIKFLTHTKAAFTPAGLKDNTPYTVMFGPDKCGATNKVRGRAGWLERLPAAAHRSADE